MPLVAFRDATGPPFQLMVWMPKLQLTARSIRLAPVVLYTLLFVGCGMDVRHTPSYATARTPQAEPPTTSSPASATGFTVTTRSRYHSPAMIRGSFVFETPLPR